MTQNYLNELTSNIIGIAIEVHRELGPGLLEGFYEKCMIHLLKEKGFYVSSQQKVPLVFRGLYLDCDLRFDLMVENAIIAEIKAVDCRWGTIHFLCFLGRKGSGVLPGLESQMGERTSLCRPLFRAVFGSLFDLLPISQRGMDFSAHIESH